ncbi:hypothetical protein [Salipiger aestuarii]|uniref:hypothetical protein n=1 Tax=Salipiger aestuarii TaxID=568098 RepID=UPI00025B78AC|nr:hypothetical protein [Salipiger aestuarii]EIE52365.1 hypothetical protein C357_04060 [Citreicella sp. 357]
MTIDAFSLAQMRHRAGGGDELAGQADRQALFDLRKIQLFNPARGTGGDDDAGVFQ